MARNEVLAALADDTRRKILLKLQEGKISSGDLAIALDMTPQALSYHLSKLKKADLIYKNNYLRICGKPFSEYDFLLVAAGKLCYILIN